MLTYFGQTGPSYYRSCELLRPCKVLAPDIDMNLLAGSVVARIVASTQVPPRRDRLTEFWVKREGEGFHNFGTLFTKKKFF